jgi:hypothetical protein
MRGDAAALWPRVFRQGCALAEDGRQRLSREQHQAGAEGPESLSPRLGFALSAAGCWRPHSWVWDSTKNQIVETTELRSKYFGVTQALSQSEQSSKQYV